MKIIKIASLIIALVASAIQGIGQTNIPNYYSGIAVTNLQPAIKYVRRGTTITFTLTAFCYNGLSQVGVNLCDSARNPIASIFSASASGQATTKTFTWTAPSIEDTYYFDGWGGNHAPLVKIVVRDNPEYYVISLNTDKVLEVTEGSGVDGVIYQADFTGSKWQRWSYIDQGDGTFVIRNVGSQKVMDVKDGSIYGWAKIVQADPNGGASQKWYVDELGNGDKKIVNYYSILAMDIEWASKENGAPLQQYPYNEDRNQQWRLRPVEDDLPGYVDMRNQFPAPIDQGNFSKSCVEFAVSYARTYQLGKKWSWTDPNNAYHMMSPAFIYGQVPVDQNGTSFSDAINVVATRGCDTWADMPYCNSYQYPTEEQFTNASRYKTKDFGWYEITDNSINKIKWALTNGNPVVIGINVLVPDGVGMTGKWKNVGLSWAPIWVWSEWPYLKQKLAPHAVCVVGFNDTAGTLICIDSLTIDYKMWGIDFTGWPIDGIKNDVHACIREIPYSETINWICALTEGHSDTDRNPDQ